MGPTPPCVAIHDLVQQLHYMLSDLAAQHWLEVPQEVLDHYQKLELAHGKCLRHRREGLGQP